MDLLNYLLLIEYEGTAFQGWQTQRKGRTIQFDIEKAIRQITGQVDVKLIGSGRTDSGVHARGQVANVKLATRLGPDKLRRAINSQLTDDVHIQKVMIVPDSFNARNSADRRRYSYSIVLGNPVLGREYVWGLRYTIDPNKLIECAKVVRGMHDFAGFSKAKADVNSTLCRIYSSRWEDSNRCLVYHIGANRFLHHMVRYLVGTMVEVARGRYSVDQFSSQLLEKGGVLTVYKAPARGLILEEVVYPSISTLH
jgi:tRNA pseudouridine38-40 synthase